MGIAERKEREKEQRRKEIIDAAERVFFSKGMENSTMDEVAEEAELSKGTLYLYFRSKEDLKYAISMRGSDLLTGMIDRQVSPAKNGFENLLEMAGVFIDFANKYHDYFSLFLFFQTKDLEGLKISVEQVEKYMKDRSPLSRVNACVAKGIRDGSLRDDLPVEVFAATLWSQMMGVLVVLEHKKDIYRMFTIPEEAILQSHFELVANGARKKPG